MVTNYIPHPYLTKNQLVKKHYKPKAGFAAKIEMSHITYKQLKLIAGFAAWFQKVKK